MAINSEFPESVELREIEQVTLPVLEAAANSPFLERFPDDAIEDNVVRWTQEDNYTGLMGWRGYEGKPNRVQRIGAQDFIATPGVYGDFIQLNEAELTRRRMFSLYGKRMSTADMEARAQRQLLVRRLQLKEKIVTDFVTTGAYSVADGTGQLMTGDTFTQQTYAAPVAWSDTVNSTPLADIQAACQVAFGTSARFDETAELVINQLKFNQLIRNRNNADFWGFRQGGGATVSNTLANINQLLMGQGLPKIRVYDGFYLADDGSRRGVATRYMATNKFVLFGNRTSGARIGSFLMTACLPANGESRPYNIIKSTVGKDVPGFIEVHHGFNGGPTIQFPSAIVAGTGI